MVDPHRAHISKGGGGGQQAARTTSAESTRRHWPPHRSTAATLSWGKITTCPISIKRCPSLSQVGHGLNWLPMIRYHMSHYTLNSIKIMAIRSSQQTYFYAKIFPRQRSVGWMGMSVLTALQLYSVNTGLPCAKYSRNWSTPVETTTRSSAKNRFFGLHFTRRMYPCIFYHFCIIRPKSYRIGEITQTTRPITPFKVIQGHRCCTSRKLIYDFLLVINTNLPPILHRFQVMSDYWSKMSASESGVSHFNALTGGDPCQYLNKWYIAKN